MAAAVVVPVVQETMLIMELQIQQEMVVMVEQMFMHMDHQIL
jgi:hypothetical protein